MDLFWIVLCDIMTTMVEKKGDRAGTSLVGDFRYFKEFQKF